MSTAQYVPPGTHLEESFWVSANSLGGDSIFGFQEDHLNNGDVEKQSVLFSCAQAAVTVRPGSDKEVQCPGRGTLCQRAAAAGVGTGAGFGL